MRRFAKPRWVPPLLLGCWLLPAAGGCFYLPTPEHGSDMGSADFRRMVGPEQSDAPIREGVTRSEEVVDLLGEPYRRLDGREWMYYYWPAKGYDVRLVPMHGWGVRPRNRRYFLLLWFDESWTVQKYAVAREREWGEN